MILYLCWLTAAQLDTLTMDELDVLGSCTPLTEEEHYPGYVLAAAGA